MNQPTPAAKTIWLVIDLTPSCQQQ